jgi:hypothetical protein
MGAEIILGVSTLVLFVVLIIEIIILNSRRNGEIGDEVKEVKAVMEE